MQSRITQVNLENIFLNLNNPRHPEKDDQSEVIAHLCSDEKVLQIAKDIKENSLNPAENLILSAHSSDSANYTVRDGNRRICALKLLQDPDLAPSGQKDQFRRLADGYTPIESVQAVIMNDESEVKLWLNKLHGGQDDGRGKLPWKAEQKAKNTNYKTNTHALKLLDIAQGLTIITTEQRKNRLSVVQRYLKARAFKDNWMLDLEVPNVIKSRRSQHDIRLMLGVFMTDLIQGTISTRTGGTAQEIKEYVQKFDSIDGLDNERQSLSWSLDELLGQPEPIVPSTKTVPKNTVTPQKKVAPLKQGQLKSDKVLLDALTKLGNAKIYQLYASLCNVELKNNECLITVGLWSFLDSIKNLHSNNYAESSDRSDFYGYFNKIMNEKYPFDGNQKKAIKQALERIHMNGNITKHHHTAAMFDANQIMNDFEVITPLLRFITGDINTQQKTSGRLLEK